MSSDKAILIIDDEIDLCLLLKDYFSKKNFIVRVANTLAEGIACLSDYEPKILLLDCNLVDGIGWALAPSLAVERPDIYILLMSAYDAQPPIMPPNAKFKIIEKPISGAALNKYFEDIYTNLKGAQSF